MGASALATTPTWSGALTATAKPGNDPYLHPGGVRTLGEFDYDQVALLDGPAPPQREMTRAVVQPVPEDNLLETFRHQETLPAPGLAMGLGHDGTHGGGGGVVSDRKGAGWGKGVTRRLET